jgi:predicted metal-binding membrane protein
MTAAGLVLMAWLALVAWSLSPYAEWLNHAQMEDSATPAMVQLAVFTLGWILMIIAMMLPGTLVLLARGGENKLLRARLIAPVILAYLAVWTVFGSVSYLADGALHEMVEQVPSLGGIIAPGVLILAGVYQLTPMKRVCLSRGCAEGEVYKTLEHPSRRRLWTIGLRYGLFCLGSCWPVMLLMFAIGGVNLVWMLVLGAIMAAERLSRHGENVAQYLGVVLIIASVVLIIV